MKYLLILLCIFIVSCKETHTIYNKSSSINPENLEECPFKVLHPRKKGYRYIKFKTPHGILYIRDNTRFDGLYMCLKRDKK